MRNTKNDRVPSASKSSCIKNKEVEVEEHPGNLLLYKNQKHMSSECNNIKLAIWNAKSEVVCAMCKQCLFTANRDVCVLNYVNGVNSHADNQNANVSKVANQKKHKEKWSPTGRTFDLSGKLIQSSDFECQSDISEGDNVFPNLFMLRRLRLFQAYDRESKAAHQLRLEVYGNCLENRVVERRNRTLVEAARTMLIFSCAPLFLWSEAIATNDRKDIRKLGVKVNIGFFIGYSAISCAYIVYNRRTRKIMETMNVTFDELSAMSFEQHSSKHELQGMTSRHITMYDDYIGGQSSNATRTIPAAPGTQNLHTPNVSTTTIDFDPTPTNSSTQAPTIPKTSHDVDELRQQQPHVQQQDNQA
ncbi:hypothetical protein Tco_0360775 [Tanacetum coccineum]